MSDFDLIPPTEVLTKAPALRWDIFCRVIDNFGDAGVCWRLARQLAESYGQQVRLWIDEPEVLAQLCPSANVSVEIHPWTAVESIGPADCSADVVIEAFACELPKAYLVSMASRKILPCWINLEYLSAEDWVEGCHGLASPHPRLPLKKHFFFPGFTAKAGGLLWGKPPAQRPGFLSELGVQANFVGMTISLFSYDHLSADGWLVAWRESTVPVRCLVPPGKPRRLVERSLGQALDCPLQQGNLTLIPIPFVSQPDYDQLLLACDLNFVRGEDSFVRAQWAGKPFIWQIYPQAENAHQDKLNAFLIRYCGDSFAPFRQLHACWNLENDSLVEEKGGDIRSLWEDCLQQFAEAKEHAQRWARHYQSTPDLADRLVKFVGKFSCLSV
jgi:uncharacterized repeat protein (TIGR03837 family)